MDSDDGIGFLILIGIFAIAGAFDGCTVNIDSKDKKEEKPPAKIERTLEEELEDEEDKDKKEKEKPRAEWRAK